MSKVDTIQVPDFEGEGPGYEEDFCAWLDEQGARLRMVRMPGIDTENLAEEIEGLARRDRNKLASRTIVILLHLLKWKYQPSHRSASWELTLLEQRRRMEVILDDSPSLRPTVAGVVQQNYPRAVREAVLETGLPREAFPAECEWGADEIISSEFLP